MQIEEKIEGSNLTLLLDGNLDKLSSPDLESKIESIQENVEVLKLDFEMVEYISSAGLRVLAKAQEKMDKAQGKLIVTNLNNSVMSVLQMTGFINILTIE